tara:strand:+ start:240 stop:443 length:204 start_codon:yes stop_codon:yes gene_type:complete
MNFKVRCISGGNNPLSEMTVDEIETGTLNSKESLDLAYKMITAADELLSNSGFDCDGTLSNFAESLN